MMNTIARFILLATFAWILSAGVVSACPNCKDSLIEVIPTKDGPMLKTEFDAANARANFNSSIYLMLGGFAVVAGGLGLFVVKGAKSVTGDPPR